MVRILLNIILFMGTNIVGADLSSTSQQDVEYTIALADKKYVKMPRKLLAQFALYENDPAFLETSNLTEFTVNFSDHDYTEKSFALVKNISQLLYDQYSDFSSVIKDIKFPIKAQMYDFLKKEDLKDIVLCIKAFNHLQAPGILIDFLGKEFARLVRINIVKKQSVDLPGTMLTTENMKHFSFLKRELINVLATTNIKSFAKKCERTRIPLSGVKNHNEIKTIIHEAMVQGGNLYAYMLPDEKNHSNDIYLIDLFQKKAIWKEKQIHVEEGTGQANNRNITGLYAARDMNVDVIASIVSRSDVVLFHTRYGLLSPLKLMTPPLNIETKYALSADCKYFLAIYPGISKESKKDLEGNVVVYATKKEDAVFRATMPVPETSFYPKGCLFNPSDSDTFLYYNDKKIILAYQKYNISENKMTLYSINWLQRSQDEQHSELLGVQFGEDGREIFIVTVRGEIIECYKNYYFDSIGKKDISLAAKEIQTVKIVPSGDHDQVFVELYYIDKEVYPTRRFDLIKYDFGLSAATILGQHEEKSFDVQVNGNLVVYKTKEVLHIYDSFLRKEVISGNIGSCRAILGFSSDDLLWLRYDDYLTCYTLFDKKLEIDDIAFDFDTCMKLLMSPYNQWESIYKNYIKTIMPEDLEQQEKGTQELRATIQKYVAYLKKKKEGVEKKSSDIESTENILTISTDTSTTDQSVMQQATTASTTTAVSQAPLTQASNQQPPQPVRPVPAQAPTFWQRAWAAVTQPIKTITGAIASFFKWLGLRR